MPSEVEYLLSELNDCAEKFRSLLDELEAVCVDECYSEYCAQDSVPPSVVDFVIDWCNQYDMYPRLEHDILPMLSYSSGELINVIESSFYAAKQQKQG